MIRTLSIAAGLVIAASAALADPVTPAQPNVIAPYRLTDPTPAQTGLEAQNAETYRLLLLQQLRALERGRILDRLDSFGRLRLRDTQIELGRTGGGRSRQAW